MPKRKGYRRWLEDVAAMRGWNANEMANDPTYNYKVFYDREPALAAGILKDSPDAHFSDVGKTAEHPTFSNESVYSGRRSIRNPRGIIGGTWSEDGHRYTLSRSQVANGWNIPRTIDYLSEAEDNGVRLLMPNGSTPIVNGIPFGGVLPAVTVYGHRESDLRRLTYEQLDSLLAARYNQDYQQYLLDLDAWNKKESQKDLLDKVEPYVDGFNFITSQIGKALDATGYGAPVGAIIETAGDVPGVMVDVGQFARDSYRIYRNPNPENRDNLTQDILDLGSSIGDIWDPTGMGKDIYFGGKYGYQLMNSDKPTPPRVENTEQLYNRLHNKLGQDNTRVDKPRIILQRISPKKK